MKKAYLNCVYCRKEFTDRDLHKRGVIKARSESEGGPYFIYKCIHCREEMTCVKGSKGWILRPCMEDWGVFEFFRRILEGYVPFLGAEEREKGRAFASRSKKASWGRHFIKDNSWRKEKEERKVESESVSSAREKVPERWKAFYRILGVGFSASREDVISAFRSLSKKVHPDRFMRYDKEFQEIAHRKFIELKKAYDTLLKERYSGSPLSPGEKGRDGKHG